MPLPRIGLVACLALAGGLAVGPATAHEAEDVGAYVLTAGWADEPTFVGMKNWVQLVVRQNGQPVESLADSIRVEVRFGDETTGPMPMQARFDAPGEYRTGLIPTRPGVYVFHFTGQINGEPLDQEFSPPGFDEARTTADIEFPVADPSRAELAQSVEQTTPRLEAALASADSAESTARLAVILAVAALLAGILGVVLALAGRRTGARR